MPREVHFYECGTCEEQYDTYAEAETCEWTHEMVKEGNRSCR